jgi:hypothetical protein
MGKLIERTIRWLGPKWLTVEQRSWGKKESGDSWRLGMQRHPTEQVLVLGQTHTWQKATLFPLLFPPWCRRGQGLERISEVCQAVSGIFIHFYWLASRRRLGFSFPSSSHQQSENNLHQPNLIGDLWSRMSRRCEDSAEKEGQENWGLRHKE